MRILQVHTRYREPGGEDAVVEAELDLLARAGHIVTPWHVSNPSGLTRSAAALALAPHNPLAARRFREQVSAEAHDLAHVHNTWFALSPSVVKEIADMGIPQVMTLHNYRMICANALLSRDGGPCELCVGTHPFHGVRYACYRDSRVQSLAVAATISSSRAFKTLDGVGRFIALSQFAKERFVAGGIAEDRLTVIPNFASDPGRRATPPSQSDVVLAVGRLGQGKGFETLIRAWRLRRSGGLRLRIVGDGPLRHELERIAPEGVEFAGRLGRHQVQQEMLAARVLAFPTTFYENMPMSVVEAWAAGLPVLGSNLGATAEMLEGFDDRWKVVPDDKSKWAEAFGGLHNATAIDTASALARTRYEANHSPPVALAAREGLYRTVANL